MEINLQKTRIIGLVYIITAVLLTFMGLTKSSLVDEFNIYWMMTSGAYILGALLSLGKVGVQGALYVSRIVVGSLFVVSGLIKANDTLGFSYKLEEYFEPSALGYMAEFWTYFYDYSLVLSILVSGAEVVLGLMLLFGVQSRWVVVKMLGLTVFFAWLTYYTASCNDAQSLALKTGEEFAQTCVNDCGCFGDALRGSIGRSLTPWESFYKDLALMFFVLLMVVFSKHLKRNETKQDIIIIPLAILAIALFGGGLFGWMFPTYFTIVSAIIYLVLKRVNRVSFKSDLVQIFASVFLTYAFAIYTLNYLPIKDYRPYAEGKNLVEQMKSAEELGVEAPEYAILYTFKNKFTQEDTTVLSSDYLRVYADDHFKTTYEAVSYEGATIKIKDGYEPPITEQELEFEDLEIFDKVKYSEKPLLLVVSYDLSKVDEGAVEDLNELNSFADNSGFSMYGVTNTSHLIESFKSENKVTYDITSADEKILKAVVRSNPGLVLFQNGNILGKWSAKDLPSEDEIISKLK